MEIEKHYLLKQKTELLTFGEISHIEYKEQTRDVGYGVEGTYAIVTVVNSFEREIKISGGRRGPQYELARAISEAVDRPLEE